MGIRLNGRLLKEMRRAEGMRQEDLLALCEGRAETTISERSLRNAEAGRPVGVDVYTRLARVFRVDPSDQLLAEKALTLKQLRRRGADDAPKVAGRGSHSDRARPAEGVTRVSLDLQQRKQLRLFVLEAVTPESGTKLPKFGTCLHGEDVKGWPRSTFEGFLSACLHYLKHSLRPMKGEWSGETYAISNSTLMGQHLLRVWGTGEADEVTIPPSDPANHEYIEMWERTGEAPAGLVSENIHRFCPALEPNSFYHGWRELNVWLTRLAVEEGMEAEEEHRKIPQNHYSDLVLQMIATYLDKFEANETYGQGSFWGMVRYFLMHEYGEPLFDGEEATFAKYHDYPLDEFWGSIREELEFNEGAKESFGGLIGSYPDRDTGIEVALLTLRTQFIYTGKPKGELAQIKASRHP